MKWFIAVLLSAVLILVNTTTALAYDFTEKDQAILERAYAKVDKLSPKKIAKLIKQIEKALPAMKNQRKKALFSVLVERYAETGSVALGDTVVIDYVGTFADGKMFDASREEDAKAGGVYQAARTYEPLQFTVGEGQMIAGFDKAVVGMKIGETKTFTVDPKDAYGESTIEQTFPRSQFADTITQTVAKEDIADRSVHTFSRKFFADSDTFTVGKKIQIADGIDAEVVSMTDTDVTLAIENAQSPFYKRPLKVGLTGEYQGNTITISEETATEYVLSIDNKANPFYGKLLAIGLTGHTQGGETLTITALTEDTVTIAIPNTHELAGKVLTFSVTLLDINPKTPSAVSVDAGATTATGITDTSVLSTGTGATDLNE